MYVKIQPKKIVVHHTAVANLSHQLSAVNAYHQERGFRKSELGYFVGYHYFIEKNGIVIQTRLEDEVGMHTKNNNYTSIGIALAGNFDYEQPTANQQITLCKILEYLTKKYTISLDRIYLHRQLNQTACPGSNIPNNWVPHLITAYFNADTPYLFTLIKALYEKLYNAITKKN